MTKADAYHCYRNEILGFRTLTEKEKEDVAYTINCFGLEECKKAFKEHIIKKHNKKRKNLSAKQIEYLNKKWS